MAEINTKIVADAILKKVKHLELGRTKIDKLAKAKAETLVEFKKQVAISTATKKANGTPTTIIDKVIYEDEPLRDALYASDMAEMSYKAFIVKMDALKAELNGWQSINRHLSEV